MRPEQLLERGEQALGRLEREPHICLAFMDELAAYERRLRRTVLPLLIEDYSAYEDVFTRAVPLLHSSSAAR